MSKDPIPGGVESSGGGSGRPSRRSSLRRGDQTSRVEGASGRQKRKAEDGPQEEEHPSVPEEQEERGVQLEMGRREGLRSGEHRARRDREQQGDDDRSGDARSRRRASQFDAGALDEQRLHQFLPSPRGREGGRHFDEGPGYLDLY